MFDRSSPFYDEIYSFMDYDAAAAELHRLVIEHGKGETETLLDVACGTGRYLELLQEHYTVAGLDINPVFLEMAKQRCPSATLFKEDMRHFKITQQFDVITCLFCSIGYLTTLADMEQAVRCMASHLSPQGVMIVEPWISPAQCWTNRVNSEVLDRPDLKIVRMHTYEKEGITSVYDIHYLIGTPSGVEHFVEKEVLGLFSREQYLAAFNKAGLCARVLDKGLFPGHNYGIIVATRVAS
ncbi:class I SAM-dependent methyltransferase [Verrucomicrobiales bacterium]|nr:class I SAM-dependent methyltransferase [Verrucomicrobiales bacterium]MDB3941731.1 class I SAM-dependent methyltransferase [Verrucomicrobiales bacterium]MDC3353268.1 class I SAM-dependent methyltransferase [Verrucomicrobiales bacterium]